MDSSESLVAQISSFLLQNLIVVIPTLIFTRFLIRKYASPLRKYPGPFLASGSRAWMVYRTWLGHLEEDHIKLHQTYGPIVRIAPNQVSFSSPEAARQILAPGKGFNKTDFYWVFPPPGEPDIFTEIREDVHAQKKRIVATPYSLATFQAMTPYIDQTIRLLCEKVSESASSNQSFRLGDYLHYFAFDVLGEVAFSSAFGFLEQGKDVGGVIAFIDSVQTYDGICGQVPWWDYLLRRNPIWYYLRLATHFSQNYLTQMALGLLQKRMASGKTETDRRDLLCHLLEAHQKDPEKFTPGNVFAVAHGAIAAGADSTASTMQTFMWRVLNTDGVYEHLQKEIDDAHKEGKLSEVVTWDEAKELPYFQACLKEAMRIAPAVGLNIVRYVPVGGATIDGTWFPSGTEAAINGWVLHRDAKIFGKSPEAYQPERWLPADGRKRDEEDERIKAMDRYMFQFGGGSHVCIGKNLAILEMNKVLPQILRQFKFKMVSPGKPMKKHSSFFVVQEGLDAYVERRDLRQ